MLRLFIGIKIPTHIQNEINNIRGGLSNAKWIPRSNYHLTLRFLGDISERDAEEIHYAMSKLKLDAFDMHLKTLGYFTKGKAEPRTLWLGVSDYQKLDYIKDKVNNAVKSAGVMLEKNRFHAHCSIAKLRGVSIISLQEYITENNLFRTSDFKVEELCLFSSKLNHEGAKYTILEEYPLSDIEILTRRD